MAIEVFGKYRLHLVPIQISATGQWAPYLVIDRFDDGSREFKRVLEKRRVSGRNVFPTIEKAIDEARRVGNELVATRQV
jgi:hypothetical protein